MNDLILQHIKQLPALPESIVKIESVYHNPKSTFNDMADIIKTDPLLTADILKAANSPLYGFAHEIRSVSKAVGLFGMGTVRGFAMASVIKKSFTLDMSAYRISNDEFANISSMLNAIAVLWYIKKDPGILDLLSPATFLVEIGKVLISHYIINEKLSDKFFIALKDMETLSDAEKEIIGVTTVEVSAALFRHWNFDEDLIDVIANADMPQNAKLQNQEATKILRVLRVAVTLDATLTKESIDKAEIIMQQYGLDIKSFEAIINDIKI